MMRVPKIIDCLFAIVVVLGLTGCANTGTSSNKTSLSIGSDEVQESVDIRTIAPDDIGSNEVINRQKDHVKRTGEIYMMRGLADTFSRGIDTFAANLRDLGYDAVNFSYTQWLPVAENLVARNKNSKVAFPVIIMGHSLGGNESSKFANYIAERGVAVEYVVTFDPVETGQVGPGIKKFTNYYLPISADNRIYPSSGFSGSLENVDLSSEDGVTHTNIEKNERLQSLVLNHIQSVTKRLKTKRTNYSKYQKPGR